MNRVEQRVLIVILNYGTYEMTIGLIKQIKTSLEYSNYSIMVIDNSSPNESASVLKKKSSELGFVFYPNTKNAGYAAGNNIGIRYGVDNGYKYTLILNSDVEIREANFLFHMVGIMEKEKSVACVGPKIISRDGSVCAPYHKRPSFFDLSLGMISYKRARTRHVDKPGYVYRVHGCCMLLRNEAMNEIDYMDERTFLYCEEEILAERLIEKEYRAYYDPIVSVKHNESGTIRKVSKKSKQFKIRERKKSRTLYLREYRNFNSIQVAICNTIWRIIYLIRG